MQLYFHSQKEDIKAYVGCNATWRLQIHAFKTTIPRTNVLDNLNMNELTKFKVNAFNFEEVL